MSYKFYPLPESKLDNVLPVLETAFIELDTPRLASVAQAMESFRKGYQNRTIAVYVNDVTNPTNCLVLATVPSLLFEGLTTIVLLIYSPLEDRGNREILDAMHLTIDNYAKLHRAATIIGSSWTYGDSRPIDSMWKSRGYREQEVIYNKEI